MRSVDPIVNRVAGQPVISTKWSGDNHGGLFAHNKRRGRKGVMDTIGRPEVERMLQRIWYVARLSEIKHEIYYRALTPGEMMSSRGRFLFPQESLHRQ